MFWVVQKNFFNEYGFPQLIEQLDIQEVPYALVDLRPFMAEITPDVNVEGPVFVCGSTGIGHVARKKGWTPGYFEENLDYGLLVKHYGEHMLNHDAVIGELATVTQKWHKFFVRPVLDRKQFTGQVMDWENFESWRQKILKLEAEGAYMTLNGSDQVVMAALKHIYAEYRFFVVDGRVITGSMYKCGPQVIYNSQVDERVRDYAQARVNDWQPNRAFVIDIADTEEGLKVLEINAINSSGFYACDMGKVVHAVNQMQF